MASKSKAAPAIKPLDRPLIEGSLTKLAFVGNLGRVRELLDPPDGKSAADVAEKDAFGCTALTWASRNGNLDVMRFLLEKDGDVESVSYGGFKPIHHAANMSKEVIIRELISSGCNVSSLDDGGNTALHWAAARGVLNIVLQLLEAGCRCDDKNTAGVTPLHKAASNGHPSIVNVLLKEGANVNEQDGRGDTPLHAAASAGFDVVVRALVTGGAKLIANFAGKTAADVASTPGVRAELAKIT